MPQVARTGIKSGSKSSNIPIAAMILHPCTTSNKVVAVVVVVIETFHPQIEKDMRGSPKIHSKRSYLVVENPTAVRQKRTSDNKYM
jgi:hypothetical protein